MYYFRCKDTIYFRGMQKSCIFAADFEVYPIFIHKYI